MAAQNREGEASTGEARVTDWDGPEFDYQGNAVGLFIGSPPEGDGNARYAPFRGEGHYEMQAALKAGPARCSYVSNGTRIWFDVINCPDYGVLTVANFGCLQ